MVESGAVLPTTHSPQDGTVTAQNYWVESVEADGTIVVQNPHDYEGRELRMTAGEFSAAFSEVAVVDLNQTAPSPTTANAES